MTPVPYSFETAQQLLGALRDPDGWTQWEAPLLTHRNGLVLQARWRRVYGQDHLSLGLLTPERSVVFDPTEQGLFEDDSFFPVSIYKDIILAEFDEEAFELRVETLRTRIDASLGLTCWARLRAFSVFFAQRLGLQHDTTWSYDPRWRLNPRFSPEPPHLKVCSLPVSVKEELEKAKLLVLSPTSGVFEAPPSLKLPGLSTHHAQMQAQALALPHKDWFEDRMPWLFATTPLE